MSKIQFVSVEGNPTRLSKKRVAAIPEKSVDQLWQATSKSYIESEI